jgi:hypothetical protein
VAVISPPYLLGAGGQVLSGRLGRLALGATFRPAATGMQVVSGVLAGPPNTQGELSLVGTTLTVQAFRAVIQSALDATAGSYLVPNDAPVTFTTTAQHASQFRRSLIAVRVDDSQVSGVASSSTTDRATLEVLDGALAVSQAAAVLPTPAGSWLALGEILIPPAGQTVTLTPYNPRTGMRHGILPVLADGSTITGHDGAPGTAVGQYRDHPVRGLERWDGTLWSPVIYGAVRGKMWRNQGFAGAMTVSTQYTTAMGAARLSGGFVWGGGDNVAGASSWLQIPFDGMYDLIIQGYITGGSTATGAFLARRVRAGVGDSNPVNVTWYKSSGGVDHQQGAQNFGIPLRAGDLLYLVQMLYGTSNTGGLVYYGISETNGSMLTATYAGPLSGAVPV